jgi:beta-lactamase regulating signal transducer with metallopeptidase domain
MELFGNLISEPYLFALGWMIMHAFWQIAAIGLILWLGLSVFNRKSAAFKYKLSLLALALITASSLITFGWYLQGNPSNEQIALSKAEWAYLTAQPDLLQELPSENKTRPDWILISKRVEQWIPSLVNIWLIGAFLFFFKTASNLADLRSLHKKKHGNIPEQLSIFIEKISKQLSISRPIKTLCSKHTEVPLTYGIIKPVILIPSALIFQMSPGQLEAIIAHEMAHIKRNDYPVNLIQSVLEMVFFFHPVFWWINHEIKKQREMACDEMAVALGANPKDLAYGLANVINLAQNHAPEMAMAVAKKSNPTLERIKKIMGVKTSPTQPTTLTTVTMMITFILGATLLVGASDQKSQSSDNLLLTQAKTQTIDMEYQMVYKELATDTVPKTKKIFKDSTSIASSSPEFLSKPPKPYEPTKYFEVFSQGVEGLFDGMEGLFEGLDAEWGEFIKIPHLEVKGIPMPDFNMEEMPKWELDNESFKKIFSDSAFIKMIPFKEFNWEDSTSSFKFKLADKSQMSKEEWEQFRKQQKEQLAKWKENNGEQLEVWQQERLAQTEEWKKSFEPKVKEFQKKMEQWEKENQPKIEEYQARVKAWEEENQPKIEEFQRKMEEWQKANEEKMEAWQKALEAEIKALEQKLKKAESKKN